MQLYKGIWLIWFRACSTKPLGSVARFDFFISESDWQANPTESKRSFRDRIWQSSTTDLSSQQGILHGAGPWGRHLLRGWRRVLSMPDNVLRMAHGGSLCRGRGCESPAARASVPAPVPWASPGCGAAPPAQAPGTAAWRPCGGCEGEGRNESCDPAWDSVGLAAPQADVFGHCSSRLSWETAPSFSSESLSKLCLWVWPSGFTEMNLWDKCSEACMNHGTSAKCWIMHLPNLSAKKFIGKK